MGEGISHGEVRLLRIFTNKIRQFSLGVDMIISTSFHHFYSFMNNALQFER